MVHQFLGDALLELGEVAEARKHWQHAVDLDPVRPPFGFSGPARQAAVLLASMPAAVVTTVLALEFELDPSFATSAVFVSTMLSPFSLVLIIAYLQRF